MIKEDFEAFVTPGGLEALIRSGFRSADEEEVRAWAREARCGASPGSLEALERMNMAIDVREVLPVISVPTLVMHQRDDPWVRLEHGRYLAEHIAGAAFVELEGDSGALSCKIISGITIKASDLRERNPARRQ